MRYPFLSFSSALLIWIIIFISSAVIFFKTPSAFLNIDADMINIIQPNQASKPSKIITPKLNEEEKINSKTISKPQAAEPEKVLSAKSISTKSDVNGATPIYSPLPQIPEELREEALSTFAIAHFDIAADGSATVKLIKPCENPKLNYLLLKNLKEWKFSPAKNDKGETVSSVQDIKVGFKVE